MDNITSCGTRNVVFINGCRRSTSITAFVQSRQSMHSCWSQPTRLMGRKREMADEDCCDAAESTLTRTCQLILCTSRVLQRSPLPRATRAGCHHCSRSPCDPATAAHHRIQRQMLSPVIISDSAAAPASGQPPVTRPPDRHNPCGQWYGRATAMDGPCPCLWVVLR